MPAVSKRQQRYMAACAHNPESMRGKCPRGMTKGQVKDYARTPHKGLPEKKRGLAKLNHR